MEALTISLGSALSVHAKITEIDEKLDSGSETAGRRTIVKGLIEAATDKTNIVIDPVLSVLNHDSVDLPTKVGVYYGLIKLLETTFEKQFDEYVKSLLVEKPVVPVISDEEVTALSATRKQLAVAYTSLITLLNATGVDVTNAPSIKKRTGSRGKRGPRVLTGATYQFYLNNSPLNEEENSLIFIARRIVETNSEGVEEQWKALNLRQYMAKKIIDFDPKNPPATWSITLPNGEIFSAAKKIVATESEDDDDDTLNEVEEED